jgi:hypothetical protein
LRHFLTHRFPLSDRGKVTCITKYLANESEAWCEI